MKMMRGAVLTLGSFALTGAVVANAWMQKKQFFPAVVYLTKSSPCMAVLYLQAFVFVLIMGKLMRKLFFGELRPAETEHLIERSWYAVTDTCLAFTMFRDDFSPRFVAAFTFLLFLKCFHWLVEDRVDFMERSPVISLLFKVRAISLILLLAILDSIFVLSSYNTTITKGASVQLVFGFEYAILLTVLAAIMARYVLHSIDLQSENPWENKAVYMMYVELVTGFMRVILYAFFTVVMIKIHTFPLFAVRPMYLTIRHFKKAVSDIVLSRRAIRNMNTLYPNATAEDLAAGEATCIICREQMQPPEQGASPPDRQSVAGINKKLPCGHIFHAACLRSWFQRQQTCPTCRLDVLVSVPTSPPAPHQQQPPHAAPPVNPHAPPAMAARAPGQHPFPMMPPMFPGMAPGMFMPPPPPPPPAAGERPATTSSGSQSATSATTTTTAGVNPTMFPQSSPMSMPSPSPFTMSPLPPFMMPPPFMPPPPMPPPDYRGMSDEQLRMMEGMERRAVERRLECLRDINALLDAAMMQITQYVTVARSMGLPEFQVNPLFGRTATPEPSSTQRPSPSTTNVTFSTAPTANIRPLNDVVADAPSTSGVLADDGQSSETAPKEVAGAEGAEPEDGKELRRRRIAKLDPASS